MTSFYKTKIVSHLAYYLLIMLIDKLSINLHNGYFLFFSFSTRKTLNICSTNINHQNDHMKNQGHLILDLNCIMQYAEKWNLVTDITPEALFRVYLVRNVQSRIFESQWCMRTETIEELYNKNGPKHSQIAFLDWTS